MIAIVDPGIGNISNVEKVLNGKVTDDPYEIEKADKLVIPGVGNFTTVRKALMPLEEVISDFIADGKPFLGICLGMQVLYGYNEESGSKGLDILDGKVKKLSDEYAPHIGWNTVEYLKNDPLFEDIPDRSFFYFVHSYRVDTEENMIGETQISSDERFPSVIKRGNVYGTQFHPEKSGSNGVRLLKNFRSLGDIS